MRVRFRISQTLFAGILGIVALFASLVVLSVHFRLRGDLTGRAQAELRREMGLAELVLEKSTASNPDSLTGLITSRIGHRVSIIDTSGVVLGDSDISIHRLAQVENHRSRPEVRGALAGEIAFARRKSATIGRELIYAAQVVSLSGRPLVLRIAAPVEEVEGPARRQNRAIVALALLVALVSFLPAMYLSRSLSRPLAFLAERARSLASGDFGKKSGPPIRFEEVGPIVSSFNRLADELSERVGELKREREEMQTFIDCIAEGIIALSEDARIVQINEAAKALLDIPRPILFAPVGSLIRQPGLRDLLEEAVLRSFDAREIRIGDRDLVLTGRHLKQGGAVVTFLDITEIRRLERVRSDFVANASHELKTPLTAMRGFAETLIDDDPPHALRINFLDSIRANTLRLQNLVDDLLDLSRFESGGWIARREELEVADVASETWGEMALRIGELGKKIDFSVVGSSIVAADEQGLAHVFRNLFENSIQHSQAEGEVRVEIEKTDEIMTRISISDTGAGIPSDALPRIFERFYRADPARSRQAGGTGLGLAIVRHLISSMGGEVGAESDLGQGATIWFTVPTATAPRWL